MPYFALPGLWALLAHPTPHAVSDVPVDAGEHPARMGAVAIVIRPSAQNGIEFLELCVKTDQHGIALGELLDLSSKVSGLGFGDFDARAIAVALVLSHGDVKSEELESLRQCCDLRLFGRQFEARGRLQIFGQRSLFRNGVLLHT